MISASGDANTHSVTTWSPSVLEPSDSGHWQTLFILLPTKVLEIPGTLLEPIGSRSATFFWELS